MRLVFAFIFSVLAGLAQAASSDWVVTEQYSARLITAESTVTPGMSRLSAGLEVKMAEGWKTYWEFPGEVGLPPELDWGPSTNFKTAQILYPAPTRFTAFEIENFGYEKAVTFPIEIELDQPGVGTNLSLFANLLVCADICIPASVDLTLMIEAGTEGPDPDTAPLLANALSTVPTDIDAPIAGHADNGTLTIRIPLEDEDAVGIFPHDPASRYATKPQITVASNGAFADAVIISTKADADLPENVTITTSNGSYTAPIQIQATPFEPLQTRTFETWIWAALFAFLGGLILNVMPCVLPVLSIKFAGVIANQNKPIRDLRAGFLATSAGIIAFALALAATVIGLRSVGVSFGMGMQFQSPFFLTGIIAVLVFFAANLFGAFEFSLPQSWTSSMDQAGRKEGLIGDFMTGTFAALLATPCSAPFLGTAVTYGFTGSAFDAMTMFFALGAGLAFPYLLAAAYPQIVTALPKPGHWMVWIRAALGVGVAATALWLTFVLSASLGLTNALAITAIISMGVAIWSLSKNRGLVLLGLTAVFVAAFAPAFVNPKTETMASSSIEWMPFDEAQIAQAVANGDTVFVDVTADWCLTCKANKALVLDTADINAFFDNQQVIMMVADWTRPDETIRAYLERNDRFGIPFNIVYGPAAPDGIALPELLTIKSTKDAVTEASLQGS